MTALTQDDLFDEVLTETDFWDERSALAHLRDFARARMVSPWAVLGVTLTRVVTQVPPHVVLPPTVGGVGSLNLFVALVGPSGAGKGAAEAAAAEALHMGHVERASIGSGEGIPHLYAHRDRGEVVRDRDAVLFSVPEVDNLTALAARQGATLLPQLRVAWSGERLGFAYADKAKSLPIEAHTYRMGLLLGVQPGRAGALLEDADGGTPQRFLWLSVLDPDAPDVTPPAPSPLRHPWVPWPTGEDGRCELPIPEVAIDTIRAHRRATLRGEPTDLDGHALQCRLKVAAALCLLDSRRGVTDDDWRLAGVVMAASLTTRDSVVRHLACEAAARNVAQAKAEGHRAAVVSDVVAEQASARVARRLVALLSDGEHSRSDLRKRINSRDRSHVDEALDHLAAAGQVVITDTPHGARIALDGGPR